LADAVGIHFYHSGGGESVSPDFDAKLEGQFWEKSKTVEFRRGDGYPTVVHVERSGNWSALLWGKHSVLSAGMCRRGIVWNDEAALSIVEILRDWIMFNDLDFHLHVIDLSRLEED
jgi:hypothetical protein